MKCHRCFASFGRDPETVLGVSLTGVQKTICRELLMGGWVSADHLRQVVWGYVLPDSDALCVHVSLLRKKGIEIEGRFGFGYQIPAASEPRCCPECGWEARPEFPGPDMAEALDLCPFERRGLEILKRRRLVKTDWGSSDNAAAVVINKLRKKLKPGWRIVAHRGEGWELVRV